MVAGNARGGTYPISYFFLIFTFFPHRLAQVSVLTCWSISASAWKTPAGGGGRCSESLEKENGHGSPTNYFVTKIREILCHLQASKKIEPSADSSII